MNIPETTDMRAHVLKKPIVVVAAAAALTLAACGGTTVQYELVDAPAALELTQENGQELMILDIRTPEEYAAGHIQGSVLIDFYSPDFQAQLDTLDKDAGYLVYCRSGNRSSQAMPMFKDLGFLNVTELEGGIINWAEAGFPLTTA